MKKRQQQREISVSKPQKPLIKPNNNEITKAKEYYQNIKEGEKTKNFSFRLEQSKRSFHSYLANEMLSTILLLYVQNIEDGKATLKQYYGITGADVEREIAIRKLLVESRIASKKQGKQKASREEENKLLEMLRQSNNTAR